jgi:5-methylcytosine-specific restriction enzyme subunit McrC
LVEYHKERQKFNLRPDIVINKWEIIADTKWKLLNEWNDSINYDISQADMYQLFAYAKKYKSKKLYLIYPKTENFTKRLEPFFYENWNEKTTLEVIPYDLENDICEIF